MNTFSKLAVLMLATSVPLSLVACSSDDDTPSSTPMTSTGGAGNGTGGMMATTGGTSTGGMMATGGAPMAGQTIVDIAVANGNFKTLVGAVTKAGLADTLSGPGPFTVFAPTDAAFAALPAGVVDGLSAAALGDILKYHVVSGKVLAADAVNLTTAPTVNGASLKLGVTNNKLYLNGLTEVTMTDIQASNGVIHVIDSVVFPAAFPGTIVDAVKAHPRLSTLAGAVTANVATALSAADRTLFAPVNSAFVGLTLPSDPAALEAILTYHALASVQPAANVLGLASAKTANGAYVGIKTASGVKLNDSTKDVDVIYTDFTTSNGVIHLLDKVLIPPGNIAEVATAAGLTKLTAALGAATVPGTASTFAEALTGEGPFTVFAPSNAAFDAIPAAGFGADLAKVLGVHALSGVVDSKGVVKAITDNVSPDTISSATDKKLALALVGNDVLINRMVKVTATDIPAKNGIIHLVDAVILPSDVTFPGNFVEALSAYPQFSSLVTAVTKADAGVATALTGAGPLTLFAPGNAAFTGIDVNQNLTGTLLYHVLPLAADSTFVVGNFSTPAATATAASKDVTVDGTALKVNDSNIVRVDLNVSNGVVHIIDKVLTPPAN
ncbi:MAG: fasciclin domain-containing protein [Polyangiaceae bacterium]|nr:fasciclin domain-containing protein [Polyangiaceae bacterium]